MAYMQNNEKVFSSCRKARWESRNEFGLTLMHHSSRSSIDLSASCRLGNDVDWVRLYLRGLSYTHATFKHVIFAAAKCSFSYILI